MLKVSPWWRRYELGTSRSGPNVRPRCGPEARQKLRLSQASNTQVQRQSCDLVAAINAILDVQPAAEHVMMMEDDWLFCPHGLESLRYFLSKACAMQTTHIPCISHACIVHTPCIHKLR